jgi:hypothetical protein
MSDESLASRLFTAFIASQRLEEEVHANIHPSCGQRRGSSGSRPSAVSTASLGTMALLHMT